MKLNKFNMFMGYFLHALGIFKMIALAIAMLYALTMISSISQGNEVFYNQQLGKVENLSAALGFIHIFALISSIVMIFVNSKDNTEVISGYGMAIGAVILNIVFSAIPFIIRILFYAGECALYTKAGDRILKARKSKDIRRKNTPQEIKETDWFYNQEYKGNERLNKLAEEKAKRENKIKKIENEILEWDKMLEENQIDKESYEAEVASLRNKIEKIKN